MARQYSTAVGPWRAYLSILRLTSAGSVAPEIRSGRSESSAAGALSFSSLDIVRHLIAVSRKLSQWPASSSLRERVEAGNPPSPAFSPAQAGCASPRMISGMGCSAGSAARSAPTSIAVSGDRFMKPCSLQSSAHCMNGVRSSSTQPFTNRHLEPFSSIASGSRNTTSHGPCGCFTRRRRLQSSATLAGTAGMPGATG